MDWSGRIYVRSEQINKIQNLSQDFGSTIAIRKDGSKTIYKVTWKWGTSIFMSEVTIL